MNEQVSAPRTTGKLNKIVAGVAGIAIAAGAIGAGVVGTGAWFTATRTILDNSITAGALVIGDLGEGDTGQLDVTGAFPMTADQATDRDNNFKAEVVKLTVQNKGAAAFNWTLAFSNLRVKDSAGSATTLDPAKVYVAYQSAPNVWTSVTMASFIATPPTAFTSGTNLLTDASKELVFRVYLDSTAGNDYQNAKILFDVAINAEQTNKVS